MFSKDSIKINKNMIKSLTNSDHLPYMFVGIYTEDSYAEYTLSLNKEMNFIMIFEGLRQEGSLKAYEEKFYFLRLDINLNIALNFQLITGHSYISLVIIDGSIPKFEWVQKL